MTEQENKKAKQPKTLSIKANILLSTLYQVLIVITPLITAPYISRVLGGDNVGIYSYTAANEMLFAMFAALGTGTYGAREIARKRNDKKAYSKLFWEIELLTVMTTAVVLVAWGIWTAFHTVDRIYYLILTISIVAVLFDISWFYTGLEQFRYIVTQNTIFKLLSVVAIFVFVRKQEDLPLYIGIMSATALLSNGTMWIYLPKFLTKVNEKLSFGKHFKETLIYFIPTAATSIYTILDKSLIDVIDGNEIQNGYYEQATKIINMMKALTFTALNSVLGARISFLFEEKKYEEIRARIEQSMSYILFMGVGIGCGLSAVAANFVPVFFGAGYEGAIPLLYIFSPMIVVIGISNCLGTQYYTPAGLRKVSARFIIIGAVVNLLLNLFMIRLWASIGAAIASVIAELTITVLYLIFCNGYMNLRIIWKHLWRNLIAGTGMFGLVWAIGKLIPNVQVAVVVQIIVGVVTYIGLLILLKDSFVRQDALSLVKNKLRKKKTVSEKDEF